MRMIIIDPEAMTVTETAAVDLCDFEAIQQAIGGYSFELLKPFARARLFVDANARLRGPLPARFLLPMGSGREPMSLFGKALMVLDGNKSAPEVVFPKEARVTSLDRDYRFLGFFVNSTAGRDYNNLNFQAILSDERFIAATRVVLATFEPHIKNAVATAEWLPLLELEIARDHLSDALDLYDKVLEGFGVADEAGEEDGNASEAMEA